ncbi:hypothetical protein KQX54_010031 [Cotesia glomerata]|uniref:Uncharacterized protein n=1 Tax=Cotesia glomerata TaxID=32391 RepID=A0AAV7J448_COTGL|nr:hypothetical protein KQX54_010031 [Cotesia glomerata]
MKRTVVVPKGRRIKVVKKDKELYFYVLNRASAIYQYLISGNVKDVQSSYLRCSIDIHEISYTGQLPKEFCQVQGYVKTAIPPTPTSYCAEMPTNSFTLFDSAEKLCYGQLALVLLLLLLLLPATEREIKKAEKGKTKKLSQAGIQVYKCSLLGAIPPQRRVPVFAYNRSLIKFQRAFFRNHTTVDSRLRLYIVQYIGEAHA